MVLADVDGLGIDQIEDGLGEILVGAHLSGQMFGSDCLVLVDVHGQIVVFDPLFRNALKFASDRIFGDFDSGDGLERFA